MADLLIQKYLNKLLYPSARTTDTTKVQPVVIFDGNGNVLTASGYVPADGVFDITQSIIPVVIVDQETEPYPKLNP
jgi:hypothetical protein